MFALPISSHILWITSRVSNMNNMHDGLHLVNLIYKSIWQREKWAQFYSQQTFSLHSFLYDKRLLGFTVQQQGWIKQFSIGSIDAKLQIRDKKKLYKIPLDFLPIHLLKFSSFEIIRRVDCGQSRSGWGGPVTKFPWGMRKYRLFYKHLRDSFIKWLIRPLWNYLQSTVYLKP